MMNIYLDHDLDEARRDTLNFFSDQIPFALARTINAVALDVQRRLRGSTIPNAWTTRNNALPRAMTTIIADEQGRRGMANHRRGKFDVAIGPAMNSRGYVAGEGFAERQITGETKTPRGSAVAVPIIGPGLRRGASGAIPKAKRPKNLRGNKKYFKRDGILFERQKRAGKDTIRARYVLTPQARGTNNLRRFFPDAFDTVDRVGFRHWDREFERAVQTSRFFPG